MYLLNSHKMLFEDFALKKSEKPKNSKKFSSLLAYLSVLNTSITTIGQDIRVNILSTGFIFFYKNTYASISVTIPEPTVRPPSRMEKVVPCSIATGWINSTSIVTLSPGMTISVPSGNTIVPVTSVVRK